MITLNGYMKVCCRCAATNADNIVNMMQLTDDDSGVITDTYFVCDDCYNEIGELLESQKQTINPSDPK